MRVPLIYILKANDTEASPYPAMDSKGQIAFSRLDGKVSEYTFRQLDSRDFETDGQVKVTYWVDPVKGLDWKVYVTDRRIAVWSPYTQGVFGKPKKKAGKASAGHLYYGSISNLRLLDLGQDRLVLAICCYRPDGTNSFLSIESSDKDKMTKIATELHNRIDQWIEANELKLSTDARLDNTEKVALFAWNTLESRLWPSKDNDENTYVPAKSWELVPNSRVSSLGSTGSLKPTDCPSFIKTNTLRIPKQ